jgi:hypothetical protein
MSNNWDGRRFAHQPPPLVASTWWRVWGATVIWIVSVVGAGAWAAHDFDLKLKERDAQINQRLMRIEIALGIEQLPGRAIVATPQKDGNP